MKINISKLLNVFASNCVEYDSNKLLCVKIDYTYMTIRGYDLIIPISSNSIGLDELNVSLLYLNSLGVEEKYLPCVMIISTEKVTNSPIYDDDLIPKLLENIINFEDLCD